MLFYFKICCINHIIRQQVTENKNVYVRRASAFQRIAQAQRQSLVPAPDCHSEYYSPEILPLNLIVWKFAWLESGMEDDCRFDGG